MKEKRARWGQESSNKIFCAIVSEVLLIFLIKLERDTVKICLAGIESMSSGIWPKSLSLCYADSLAQPSSVIPYLFAFELIYFPGKERFFFRFQLFLNK